MQLGRVEISGRGVIVSELRGHHYLLISDYGEYGKRRKKLYVLQDDFRDPIVEAWWPERWWPFAPERKEW